MGSVVIRTEWTPGSLSSRINEGEALLNELPSDSGWAPIVLSRLSELRIWLSDLQLRMSV
jgi:hypothetical protein